MKQGVSNTPQGLFRRGTLSTQSSTTTHPCAPNLELSRYRRPRDAYDPTTWSVYTGGAYLLEEVELHYVVTACYAGVASKHPTRTSMGLKMIALIAAAATTTTVSAYGFSLTAPHSGLVYSSGSSSSSITDASPRFAHGSDFNVCGSSRWQALIRDGTVSRCTFLSMATGSSEPDAPPRRFGLTMQDTTRVSRVLNRALGRILSTGDMFGSVGGKGVSDGEIWQ